MRQLVILGGGYGGMQLLSRLLTNSLPSNIHITLIDRMPYHSLKTEFYALAAGTISDQHIRVPFPTHPQLRVIYDEVTEIAMQESEIKLKNNASVPYDELVIALGCEDKYHNVPGADTFTESIQSIDASRETYRKLNNLGAHGRIAIIGAGLSGVELASELIESRPDLHVSLFDRGPHILSAFPSKLGAYVQTWFDTHRIEIVNNSNITRVSEEGLWNNETFMPYDSVVWTAGIQPNRLVVALDVEKDASGRVVVDPYYRIPETSNVYIIGDCAAAPFAPSAQLAEAHADHLAEVLQQQWRDGTLPQKLPKIKLKGILGSLGKKHGFGLVNEKPLVGRVPRLIKSGILWVYKWHKG
ncbi:MAG: NAD(P)/FAD-dependent oxidoreductase [Bacilli bacterium]